MKTQVWLPFIGADGDQFPESRRFLGQATEVFSPNGEEEEKGSRSNNFWIRNCLYHAS
jgi:hypothetical protein